LLTISLGFSGTADAAEEVERSIDVFYGCFDVGLTLFLLGWSFCWFFSPFCRVFSKGSFFYLETFSA